jgi:hypothetical protein
MRIVVLMTPEPKPFQPPPRHLLRLLGIGIEDFETEQHVRQRRPPRHQAVALKHDADLAAERLEVAERIVAAHGDLAGGRLDKAGDQVEHGRLAAAGLAKHGNDLARRDLERELVDREQVAAPIGAAEHLAHIAKSDDRVSHVLSFDSCAQLKSRARTPRGSAMPSPRSR